MKANTRVAELLERLNRLLRNEVELSALKPVQWEVLRYLQRANRFSRTPSAVTAWLGITKGTVSQSLSTLERDGFIKKIVDVNDKRVVRLTLSASGKRLLENDPQEDLADYLGAIDSNKLRMIENVLENVLHSKLEERDHVRFGICSTCKHFQRGEGAANSHRCGLLNVKLNNEDKVLLCIEHA